MNIDRNEIRIDQDDLMFHLPDSNQEMDHHTRELVKLMLAKSLEIMDPKGSYVSLEAIQSGNRDEICIPGDSFNTGRTIVRMLDKAQQYYFFMATAGSGPEELARTLLNEGQYLEGYIADLIGSSLAEAAAQYVHDQIGIEAGSSGLKITNRYSPGYCGWHVSEQQKLFSLFPDEDRDITLSESSLMSPIKSVSGLVGVGSGVNFRDYTCELCSMKDCHFRRTRTGNNN